MQTCLADAVQEKKTKIGENGNKIMTFRDIFSYNYIKLINNKIKWEITSLSHIYIMLYVIIDRN